MRAGGSDHIGTKNIEYTDKCHGISLLSVRRSGRKTVSDLGSALVDKLLVDGLHDDADGVVAGNVAGSAEGVLSDVQGHHDSADGAIGVAGLSTKDHVQEGQSGHDGAAGSTGRSHHGNAQSHDERHHDAQADGQLVHQADSGSAGGDGDHGACHVDVGAQRNHEVADLLADAVSSCTLQVDRDGSSRGLGAQSGGVAGDLVAEHLEGALVAHSTCNAELQEDADQMHDDDHKEHLPQDAQNGKGLAGLGHVDKGAADVQGQQRDDDRVQDLIDDAGEILHAIIKGIADGLAPQGGQAQAHHKGQNNSRECVKDRGDGDGEVAGQRVVSSCSDLLQSTFAHKAREQAGRHQIGCRASDQGGTVGQCHSDDEQLACAALQISDTHGNIGHDHQRDDELQERAEDSRCGNDHAAEPHREELADDDAQHNGDEQLRQQSELRFFLFHREFSSFFPLGQVPCGALFPIKAFDRFSETSK